MAGPAAEGATNWIRSLPNEEPGTNPEQDAYQTWMAQAAPGVSPDTFSADSWAAGKAFFDSLDALPGPITREALVAQLRSVGEYDAGGLIGPTSEERRGGKECVSTCRYRWETAHSQNK